MKNIIKENEFNEEYENIMFVWSSDSFFAELRDFEVLNERLNVVDRMSPNVGIYFSKQYILREVMKYTDEEIDQMDKEIKQEKKSGEPKPNDDPTYDGDDYRDKTQDYLDDINNRKDTDDIEDSTEEENMLYE